MYAKNIGPILSSIFLFPLKKETINKLFGQNVGKFEEIVKPTSLLKLFYNKSAYFIP